MSTFTNEFPHPILIDNHIDYTDSSFDINLQNEPFIDDEYLCFTIGYKLNCPGLTNLINENTASVVIKVQSPKTKYRDTFSIPSDKDYIDIRILSNRLDEKIEVIGNIISNQSIKQFLLKEHNKTIFNNTYFDLRKADILGLSSIITIPLDTSELQGPIASIFKISKINMEEPIRPDFFGADGKIDINVNPEIYNIYIDLKTKKTEFNRYLSAVIIYPVLIEALSMMKNVENNPILDTGEIEDMRWYRMISKKLSLKNICLSSAGITETANILLGDITQDALTSFKDTIYGMFTGEIEAEEVD